MLGRGRCGVVPQSPVPPMLRQALDALTHGLEHLAAGSPKDRGFAFEHIDQAAELLAKEKVRQLGERIYRGRGHESISLYEAKHKLDERHVAVESWSAVEVVREQRDIIHHTGQIPDEDTTQTYLDAVMPFFRTFLRDQFDLDLDHILGNAGVAPPGHPQRPAEKLLLEATRTTNLLPRMSIMTAATAVELVARPLVKHPDERALPIREVGRRLVQSGAWTSGDFEKYQEFLNIRNRAAHGAEDPSRTEATFAVEAAKDWVKRLGNLSPSN